jgi:hypothetical protein
LNKAHNNWQNNCLKTWILKLCIIFKWGFLIISYDNQNFYFTQFKSPSVIILVHDFKFSRHLEKVQPRYLPRNMFLFKHHPVTIKIYYLREMKFMADWLKSSPFIHSSELYPNWVTWSESHVSNLFGFYLGNIRKSCMNCINILLRITEDMVYCID